jgi:hypothetical protein
LSNRELKKILALINAKVKSGIVITYNHIEEQFLRNSKKYYKLCPKPAVKRVIGGVVSTFNRPNKNKLVWFHFWLN